MKLTKQFKEFIDSQYSKPRGIWGMYIGEKMVKQHRLETPVMAKTERRTTV